jgi:glycosyltransferase involved in cell wall biosynthesis
MNRTWRGHRSKGRLPDVSARSVEFLVPGDLQSATGGYGYDRRIIAGLREAGWRVNVHALDGSFPFPTAVALEHANAVFSGIDDGALVVADGLALGAMPEVAQRHARRVRVIALVHHPLAVETGLSREDASRLEQSERAALRSARHVVVTSEATADALAPYGVTRARISVIVPGTDEAPLAAGSWDRSRARDGSVHLLSVATLTPRKGHDLLVHALAALTALPWTLTCVGSLTRGAPETVAALRRQIHQAGLDQRISLVGEMTGDALEAAYQSADLFVLPTRHEGYGMVVAEALARGIPVISTRTGAIPDLVGPSAGLLVPPDDGVAFQDALARVLSDAALRASLREGAHRARERLPRWPQSCAKMSQVLEQAARAPVSS